MPVRNWSPSHDFVPSAPLCSKEAKKTDLTYIDYITYTNKHTNTRTCGMDSPILGRIRRGKNSRLCIPQRALPVAQLDMVCRLGVYSVCMIHTQKYERTKPSLPKWYEWCLMKILFSCSPVAPGVHRAEMVGLVASDSWSSRVVHSSSTRPAWKDPTSKLQKGRFMRVFAHCYTYVRPLFFSGIQRTHFCGKIKHLRTESLLALTRLSLYLSSRKVRLASSPSLPVSTNGSQASCVEQQPVPLSGLDSVCRDPT